jgi:hypothetical protein
MVREWVARKKLLLAIALCSIALVASGMVWWFARREPPFFSQEVRRSVGFSLYYPRRDKLPKNYTLDRSSISTNSQVVLYAVSYGSNQHIAFTIQKRPSDKELKAFHEQQLSKSRELITDIGTASITTLNEQSFVSLPTKGGSWIIVTAAKDIGQSDLAKVLTALR